MRLQLKSPKGIALIVVAFIVLLFLVTASGDFRPVRWSREAVLRTDLRTMRDAIDHYTLDKQEPPHSLKDLVDACYIREIPVGPMTHESDWVPFFGVPVVRTDLKANGLYDVHSNSGKTASDGSQYNDW